MTQQSRRSEAASTIGCNDWTCGGTCNVYNALSAFDGEDRNGVGDVCNNCSDMTNPSQRDSNGDGFANHCDADVNNNNVVNFVDLGTMKNAWESNDADADLNCNGVVNFVDLGILKGMFLAAPGPSGVTP